MVASGRRGVGGLYFILPLSVVLTLSNNTSGQKKGLFKGNKNLDAQTHKPHQHQDTAMELTYQPSQQKTHRPLWQESSERVWALGQQSGHGRGWKAWGLQHLMGSSSVACAGDPGTLCGQQNYILKNKKKVHLIESIKLSFFCQHLQHHNANTLKISRRKYLVKRKFFYS